MKKTGFYVTEMKPYPSAMRRKTDRMTLVLALLHNNQGTTLMITL
jgi:hypothetical protein